MAIALLAHKRKQLHDASSSVEGLIARSLEQIAAILIRAGLDLKSTERLVRGAFIRAAVRAIENAGGKATQSQIATIAGVSRLEVRNYTMRAPTAVGRETLKSNSRVEDVVGGWSHDAKYCDKRGKPKALTYLGANNQFASLVRKYGRDVTARTLRIQLVGRGIAEEKAGLIQLREKTPASKDWSAASSDLRFLASQLASIDFDLGRRAYVTRRISIDASDKKTIRAIQRIAADRLTIALNALASMSGEARLRGGRRSARHRLLVSSTIAMETEDNL